MEIIDLAELAKRLPDRFIRTRELIVATLDLHSARSDLRVASDLATRALELIENQPPDMEPKTYEDFILALTSSAIIYYAKAAKSTSRHRRTFDIRAHLTSDEKEAHETLCKLRDDSVAHYGPGDISPGVQLRSDHLVVPVEGGQLFAVSRHTYGTSEFGRMICEQARVANLVMQRLYEEKEALLASALDELFRDENANGAIESVRASLGDTIGDHEVARRLFEGPRVGTCRVVTTTHAAATARGAIGS